MNPVNGCGERRFVFRVFFMKCPYASVPKAKSLPMPCTRQALRPVKWLSLVLLAILVLLPARAPAEDLKLPPGEPVSGSITDGRTTQPFSFSEAN